MSDENQPTVHQTTSDRAPETPVQETGGIKEGDVKTLPQWAQDIISGARGEAANYRVKLREAEDSLKKAKSPEDFEAFRAELEQTNKALERELLITKVAAKHKLPDDLKDRLRGDTEADLEKDASALAKFASPATPQKVDPENLSGGLTPESGDDGFDPVKLAKEARARRY